MTAARRSSALNTKAKANANSASNATNTSISAGESSTDVMSAIETFGEALPGLMLESVADPDHPAQLRLHTWNGRRTITASRVEHGGVSWRSIDVAHVEFRPPWEDNFFQWLTPDRVMPQGRARRDRGYSVYRFPGENGLEFGYDDVINHHLMERKKLPGQRRLEGLLLAIGGGMPAELRGGQWLDLPLAIIAADHAEYATTLHLCTQRLQARTTIAVRRRTLIFAKPAEQEAMYLGDVTRNELPPIVEQSSPKSDRYRC